MPNCKDLRNRKYSNYTNIALFGNGVTFKLFS